MPLIWVAILSLLAIQLEQPPAPAPPDSDGFSALRAHLHLEEMAKEIHFMGSPENMEVRDYILEAFAEMGIKTEVYTGYCETQFRNRFKRMAVTENIIATIPGTAPTKSVVVAGHYDSVLSSPGAADDVHAVACMLDIAKQLKKQDHKNDIVFLITDGEEMGLLGAKAFVENRPTDDIGVLLNYEARGNSGPGIFFEWSEGNAWLVQQLKAAAKKPVSNSMAYEVYKALPNDSDFTHFKAAGIQGINHAFIDGFSYYHNPDDTPENINKSSVQHTGDNMYRLVKHFSELDLAEIPHDKDASFFNFFGNLIVYSADLDLMLLLFTMALCLSIITRNRHTLKWKSTVCTTVLMMLVPVLSIAICMFISAMLSKIYPQYDVFYTGQFYNHKWYIWTSLGIGLLLTYLASTFLKSEENKLEVKVAAGIICLIVAIALYILMPTASYLMILPCLAISLCYHLQKFTDNEAIKKGMAYFFSMIPLGLWAPITVTLYLAFSIKMLFVPALLTFFITLSMMAFFPQLIAHKSLYHISALAVVGGLLMAHFNSAPSAEKPLPSSLYYCYDADSEEAYWATNNPSVNVGNEDKLTDAKRHEISFPHGIYKLSSKTDLKPTVAVPVIDRDSSSTGRVILRSKDRALKSILHVVHTSNIKSLKLNGFDAITSSGMEDNFVADIYGFGLDSLVIDLVKYDSTRIDTIGINTMIRGLPSEDNPHASCLRRDGFSAIVQKIAM